MNTKKVVNLNLGDIVKDSNDDKSIISSLRFFRSSGVGLVDITLENGFQFLTSSNNDVEIFAEVGE